jgi:DNA-binding MarR family transcriptional regulator
MAGDTDLDIASDLCALVVYLHRSADRDLLDAIRLAELSFSQLYLLDRLRGKRYSPTIRQAAALMHLSIAGGSRVVKSLSKRGLVRRLADERDYRARRIAITDRGEQAIAALHAARLDGVLAFVEGLPNDVCEELAGALRLIVSQSEIAAHRPVLAAA